MGICSSHPRPFRKAPLVISFSCLRFTGLKSSSFWGTGRPLVTVAFNYSLTPSRGCQFKLDRTRGTFPRLSMIPMLPRWLKLTCAHGVGCLSPSQLHGVLSVCVVAQPCSLCSPMDCSPPAPLSMDFFFFNFPGKNAGVGFHFLLPGIFLAREHMPGSCIFCPGSQVPHHWHHHSMLQSFFFFFFPR